MRVERLHGAVGQAGGGLEHGQGGMLEGLQAVGAAGAITHPMIPRQPQVVLERGQQGQLVGHGRRHLGREVALQLEVLPHLGAASLGRVILGDVIQHVAEQAVGQLARAFHEPAHLQVDPPAHPLEPVVGGYPPPPQHLHEAGGGPPEGELGRAGRQAFHLADGQFHLGQPGHGIPVLQEQQQAPLVLAAGAVGWPGSGPRRRGASRVPGGMPA
jgi:hypothetical protein